MKTVCTVAEALCGVVLAIVFANPPFFTLVAFVLRSFGIEM